MSLSSLFFSHLIFVMFLMNKTVVSSTSPFLPNTPGREWKMVGYLNMTDPTQQCPDSWKTITSPRSSCGRKSNVPCDSLNIPTSGASYQTVCGTFRGYQVGSPDAFRKLNNTIATNIETYYVDGVTVTYGSPGNRHHVFTYAAGLTERTDIVHYETCPCTGGGNLPPQFVGSDYYCESGNPEPTWTLTYLHSSDVLWDRQQCGGNESTCCNPPDLPWFCKTFPNPISEDLEVRICTDQTLIDENVAIESFELYIRVPYMSVASIDTSTIIGITIASSFIVFFSLGVLVTTCICCMVKTRSKASPVQQPIVYDTIGTSEVRISEIIVDTNSAYDVAECNGNNQLPDYI